MQILENEKKAFLLLADGTIFEGLSFGAEGTTIGEVVFTTGMTGYQETLTSPDYYGQIITQTFPLAGNYGVNSVDNDAPCVCARGYIVREWCEHPSNFRCEETLDWFLKAQKVVGLYDIDTRALTRRLRDHGVMNGMITTADLRADLAGNLEKVRAFSIQNAVHSVSVAAAERFSSAASHYEVALLDYGYRRVLLDSLRFRGCSVTVLPADTTAAQVAAGGFDGVLLSNGPGDPTEKPALVENLRGIAALGLPIFGIGLGHQLMALAAGGKTVKLPYGHRGANQPVIELDSGRTFVTAQNHGYEVASDPLPTGGVITHLNANDRGCEGICYGDGRIFTVQFYPEAGGTPTDTSYLFDRFVALMQAKKEKGGM